MKRKIFLSSIASVLGVSFFTGCSTMNVDPNNPLNVSKVSPVDKVNVNQFENKSNEPNNLNKFITPGGNIPAESVKDNSFIPANDIIKEIDEGDAPPPVLTSKKIQKMEMFNMKLGDALRLILQGVNVSLFIEPNVNLNVPVNFKIVNKNIYQALKQVALSAGYYLYYDASKKAIVVSPYVERKYIVPSEIFVKRKVSISFGGSNTIGGSISPSFDINPEDPTKALMSLLKGLGSKDKIVTIDRQGGIIYVKERPNYISEIDDAIKTFVQERTMQFNVQMAVVEITKSNLKKFGMDLADLAKDHLYLSSLGGTVVNATTVGNTIQQGGVVLTGFNNYKDIDGVLPLQASKLAFKFILSSLAKMQNVQIVEEPNIIVQNHSVGFISVGDENNYIKSVNVTPGKYNPDGTYQPPTYQYNIGKYEDGLQFAVRIDKYLGRNRIGVSLAPILAYTNVVPGPQGVQLLNRKIREAMSVVSIQNGDIIILGGMKGLKGEGNKNNSGIAPGILGQKSADSNSIETLFIVRVTRIDNAAQTRQGVSSQVRGLLKALQ